jgi:hypothetical protein
MGTQIYDWAFLTATSGVLQYAEMVNLGEKVDFVFDRRTELNACIPTYNEMKSCAWPPFMARAGECIPGDDRDLMPLQMADLIAGEFLSQANGHKPSEAWKIISGAHRVAHLSGYLPLGIQQILQSQKLGKEVEDATSDILKRIYKDKEKSMKLVEDVAKLVRLRDEFFAHFQQLEVLFESDPGYREFAAGSGKFEAIKAVQKRLKKQ